MKWEIELRYEEGCGPTKVKALEAVIERCETHIKDKEDDIFYEKKEVERYKSELAKAKEEEEKEGRWWVHYSEGMVFNSRYIRNRSTNPVYYATEREAYEALAEFYKGKYEEALVKSGKARFVIDCGRICLAVDIAEFTDSYGYSNYDGLPSINGKGNFFPTRQEAEAELERRKRND